MLACYREGINAHLTAAIADGRAVAGRPADAEPVAALHRPCAAPAPSLPAMMHIARELFGGQICVTPDAATFRHPETGALAGEVLHHQRPLGRARTGGGCWPSRATC